MTDFLPVPGVFEHRTLGFSLVPPSGWYYVEAPESACFSASRDKGDAPTVLFTIQNVTGSQRTLSGFTSTAVDELNALCKNESSSNSELSLKPSLLAGKHAYTARYKLAGSSVEQTWIVLEKPPVAVVVTASLPSDIIGDERKSAIRVIHNSMASLKLDKVRCVPEDLLSAIVLAPAADFPDSLSPMKLAVPPLWKRSVPVVSENSKCHAVTYSIRTSVDAGSPEVLFKVTASSELVPEGTTLSDYARSGIAMLKAIGAIEIMVVGSVDESIGRKACVMLGECDAVTVRYVIPNKYRGVVIWAVRGTNKVFALSFVTDSLINRDCDKEGEEDERPFAIFSRIVEHCVLPKSDESGSAVPVGGISEGWHAYEDLEVGLSMRFPVSLVPTPRVDGCTVTFTEIGNSGDTSRPSIAVLFQRIQENPPLENICTSLYESVMNESANPERAELIEEQDVIRPLFGTARIMTFKLVPKSSDGDAVSKTRRLVQYVEVGDNKILLVTVTCNESSFVRAWIGLRIDEMIHSIKPINNQT